MYQSRRCLEKRLCLSLTKRATLILEIFNMINYPCGWFDEEQLPGGSRDK
jgi:hypothetical protein